MSFLSGPRSYSRKSIGAVLLVGVLTGVTVGGGVSVIAASSTKSVTVCANKKTSVLRYAVNGRCVAKTETKVMLNQMGATGAKGDPGVDATVAITQQYVCDGSDGDTVANELCKVGMTGPGGGLVFFVDYNDQHASLNYLEAAPVGWGNGITVNQDGLTGETTGSSTVDPRMHWCSNTSSQLGLDAWSNSAVGAGVTNTSTADTTCAGGAIQAASDYAGGSQSDWFLPSIGEAILMYNNLRPAGVGGFAPDTYWSSSERNAYDAWNQYFSLGIQSSNGKSDLYYVRPVRAF